MKEKLQYIVPCAVFRNEDKVLLAYKTESDSPACKNKWELPGGKLHFSLSFGDSLKKKMKEYLGTDIEVVRILDRIFSTVAEDDKTIRHVMVIAAECRLLGEIRLNREKFSEFRWFTLEQAQELERKGELVDGDMGFIEKVLVK